MALPNKIQVNAITGASQPSTIDDDINNFKQGVLDLFGIPNNTNISAAAMSMSATGLSTVIFRDTASNPSSSGEMQRNGTAMTYHNGSVVRTLATLEGAQTFTNTLTLQSDLNFAAGGPVSIGTVDFNNFSIKTSSSTQYTITAGGVHLYNTSVSTGGGDGDNLLANAAAIKFVNQAGTTAQNYGIHSNTNNDLTYGVPALTGRHMFSFSNLNPFISINFDATGNGPQLKFDVVSTSDHAAPGANLCVVYTRLSGGKTQLVARFDSGAVQVIAAEP